MTSNTTPSGEAKAQSEYSSSFAAYIAFDKNKNTHAAGIDGITTGYWVYYKFLNPVNVLYTYIRIVYAGRGYIVQYSDDGNDWHDTNAVCKSTSIYQDIYMKVSNYGKHKYWRAYCNYSSEQGSSYSANIYELNFYGRE